jgi:hypothetical protein
MLWLSPSFCPVATLEIVDVRYWPWDHVVENRFDQTLKGMRHFKCDAIASFPPTSPS